MRNYNLFSGIALLIISGYSCSKALRLGIGTGASPGPGFIPFAIAALLGLMSLYLCLQGIVQLARGYNERSAFTSGGWAKPLTVVILLVAYAAAFSALGFPLATFMLLMLLLVLAGGQTLRLSLIVSLLTVACSYVLFVVLFDLPLPRGSIWNLLGE